VKDCLRYANLNGRERIDPAQLENFDNGIKGLHRRTFNLLNDNQFVYYNKALVGSC
jgi:hypothetical protein